MKQPSAEEIAEAKKQLSAILDDPIADGGAGLSIATNLHMCESIWSEENYLTVSFDNGPFDGETRIPWFALELLGIKKPEQVRGVTTVGGHLMGLMIQRDREKREKKEPA